MAQNLQLKYAATPKNVKYLAFGAGLLVLGFAFPFVMAAAKAGLALVGLAVVGVALFALVQALPLIGQKWENKLLAMRKAEAAANPIEQMQSTLAARAKQLAEFKKALTDIYTQIQGMVDMLSKRKKDAPTADYAKQDEAVKKMMAYYENGIAKYRAGNKALEDYSQKIHEKIFEWEFAQAGKKALSAMDPLTQQNILRDILSDTAMKSVQSQFNSVFADLDLEVTSLTNSDKIEYAPGMALNLSNLRVSDVTDAKVIR